MTAEWVTAIGTIGTFVVITASAIAALLQIRHIRSGNQIAAFNELRETMESTAFREALHFIRTEVPARLKDPAILSDVVRSNMSGEYAPIRMVANLYESLGLFVRIGIMDRVISCELWSYVVLDVWNKLRPLTAALRSEYSPSIWTNFEYMAVLSQDRVARMGVNDYPAGVKRMPLDQPSR